MVRSRLGMRYAHRLAPVAAAISTLAATDPELGGSAPGIGFAIPSNLVADIAVSSSAGKK